jgi:magnesium chelatase subunit I
VKKKSESNPYQEIVAWFSKGNHVDLLNNLTGADYKKVLMSIPGLKELINKFHPDESEENKLLLMEFALHGLSEYSMLSKYHIDFGLQFKDMLSSMFSRSEPDEYSEEEDYR